MVNTRNKKYNSSLVIFCVIVIVLVIGWCGRSLVSPFFGEKYETLTIPHDDVYTKKYQHFRLYLDEFFQKRIGRLPDTVTRQLFYGRLQNEPSVSLYSMIDRHVKDYHQQVQHGMNILKRKKIVLTGLMRQQENQVPLVQKFCEQFAFLCQDYHVVIVENNSTDLTRPLLLEWAKTNTKVTLLCDNPFVENKDTCILDGAFSVSFHDLQFLPADPMRIYKMSFLRNIYVQYIQQRFMSWDYVLVMDFDLEGTLFLDGLFHSLAYLEHTHDSDDIDAVSCNGMLWNPVLTKYIYYDSFAFVGMDESRPYSTLHIEKQMHDEYVHTQITSRLERHHEPLLVKSAFGGCCLYKLDTFIRSEYNFSSDYFHCEHAFFHESMKIIVNPHFIFLIDANHN